MTSLAAVSRRRLGIALPVLLFFLAVSFVMAGLLTQGNGQRAAVYALLSDQAAGNAAAVAARLAECPQRCRTLAGRLQAPGEVKLLRVSDGPGLTFSREDGTVRVAWAAGAERGRPAVVQCIAVRREWGLLSGGSTTLLSLSDPIDPEAGCDPQP